MSDKLLIVTPTLGQSPFFSETMRSITHLRHVHVHVIVCPEATRDRLAREWPGSIVIAEPENARGLYAAINYGLWCAREEEWDWFTYINDDDLIRPGIDACLERANSTDDLCYGIVEKIDELGNCIEPISTLRTESLYLPLVRGGISGFNQQGAIMRRTLCSRIGEFDTKLKICADLDYFVRAAAKGANLRFFPVVTGAFRIRPGQISQDISREHEEKLLVYQKSDLDRFLRQSPRAKMIFRWQNSPAYLRRFLRGKFYTSYQLLSGKKKL